MGSLVAVPLHFAVEGSMSCLVAALVHSEVGGSMGSLAAALLHSAVEGSMSSLVAGLVHSAVGGSTGSLVAAPVHSVVGESMGSLADDVVRFCEFSADGKQTKCTQVSSNQLSQILSQELWRRHQSNGHESCGIFRGNRFLRFRNHRLRGKKTRCSWSYFCIYYNNNSLRQSSLKQTNSSDRHNLSQKNTSGYNSFLLLNNRNPTCKLDRGNLIRNHIHHHNKFAILDSRNQTYTDNVILERTDCCSKLLSFRSHSGKYTHRLHHVARTQSGQTVARI